MFFVSEPGKAGFLEEINPLVKLLVSTLLFILSLGTTRVVPLGILLLTLALFLTLCGLGRAILRVLPPGLFLGGGVMAVSYYSGCSLDLALSSGLRILFLFIAFLLFGATTRPITLVRALNQLKIPPALGLGLLVVARFLPVLSQEMEKIRLSFNLRAGHRKKSLSLLYRGIIIPFIFRLFTLSDHITLALQMRAFESRLPCAGGREVSTGTRDWLFLGSALSLAGVIMWRF